MDGGQGLIDGTESVLVMSFENVDKIRNRRDVFRSLFKLNGELLENQASLVISLRNSLNGAKTCE